MKIVNLFKCTDSIEDIEQVVIDDGLVGVWGGRNSVRNKLGGLVSKINISRYECVENYIYITINHPDTELGCAFDSTKYSLEKAKALVLKAYDVKKL